MDRVGDPGTVVLLMQWPQLQGKPQMWPISLLRLGEEAGYDAPVLAPLLFPAHCSLTQAGSQSHVQFSPDPDNLNCSCQLSLLAQAISGLF